MNSRPKKRTQNSFWWALGLRSEPQKELRLRPGPRPRQTDLCAGRTEDRGRLEPGGFLRGLLRTPRQSFGLAVGDEKGRPANTVTKPS